MCTVIQINNVFVKRPLHVVCFDLRFCDRKHILGHIIDSPSLPALSPPNKNARGPWKVTAVRLAPFSMKRYIRLEDAVLLSHFPTSGWYARTLGVWPQKRHTLPPRPQNQKPPGSTPSNMALCTYIHVYIHTYNLYIYTCIHIIQTENS